MDTYMATGAEGRTPDYSFGPTLEEGGILFRLWAPKAASVTLEIEGRHPEAMRQAGNGRYELKVGGVGTGTRYRFRLPDGTAVPDPASRFQPEDIHSWSEVTDASAYKWRDRDWAGRPWEEAIIYELHIGTFTPEGTYAAAAGKLDALVALGVTAIEIMPLADFPGGWNWGYDGTLFFAPDSSYGHPDDLKGLIDAAHARGLMVILDVVYNHFGPEGNYLPLYAPILTEKHHTPWGSAVNYDDEGSCGMRALVLANVRYWLSEFHIDGLRFDAVHAIKDESPVHLLDHIAATAHALPGPKRHLILENAKNEASLMKRQDDGDVGRFTAQWNDDLEHALHVVGTGEAAAYYGDWVDHIELLGRALAEGQAFQGEILPSLGTPLGEPSAFLPPVAYISFIQNHDHVGNRPLGERLGALVRPEVSRALAALYLLAPQIPMLFMGEEWLAEEPFYYFCDLPDLADAIRKGRHEELAKWNLSPDVPQPDPSSESSFRASKLDWTGRDKPASREHLALYMQLLALRRREIIPRLGGMSGFSGRYEVLASKALRVEWRLADGTVLRLTANLGDETLPLPEGWMDEHLWLEGTATDEALGSWSVVYDLLPPQTPV